MNLELLLKTAAAAQAGVAILNLFLVRLLDWKEDLRRTPLLLREVFHVHVWFISVTLTIFAILTWRFAGNMAGGIDALAAWLAACIGIFWAVRTVMQVAYYSASHWRGHTDRTIVHILLLLVYGGFAAIYLVAATRG